MKIFNDLKEKIQKLTLSQSVYPALSAILIILVLVLFVIAVRTISTLINTTVSDGTTSSETSSIDSGDFLIVAHKLGIATTTEMRTSATSTAETTKAKEAPQP